MIINNTEFGRIQGLVVPTQTISVNDLYFPDSRQLPIDKKNFRTFFWKISGKKIVLNEIVNRLKHKDRPVEVGQKKYLKVGTELQK